MEMSDKLIAALSKNIETQTENATALGTLLEALQRHLTEQDERLDSIEDKLRQLLQASGAGIN